MLGGNMDKKRTLLVLLILIINGFAFSIYAENDQTVVMGVGYGIHSFNEIDDTRAGSDYFGNVDEVNVAGTLRFYLEWYMFENLGLGAKLHNLGVSRTYSTWTSSTEQKWEINNIFATVNIVPIGGKGYARFGILAGFGPSSYQYTATTIGTGDDTSLSESKSSMATLLEAYIDWGGEAFGARLAYSSLSVAYDDLEASDGTKTPISASGGAFCLDLRYAF